jgi:hypothetical protein
MVSKAENHHSQYCHAGFPVNSCLYLRGSFFSPLLHSIAEGVTKLIGLLLSNTYILHIGQ